MKNIVCVTGILAAAFLNACSQDVQEPVNPVTAAALNAVQDCIAEMKACVAAAMKPEDGQACQDKLRACMAPLLPMGGAGGVDAGVSMPPISVPSVDGGVPSVPVPAVDAGVPSVPGGGAGLPSVPGGGMGLPSLPIFGGGAGLPSVPGGGADGGVPSVPGLGADAGVPSVPGNGGQMPDGVKSCLTTLKMCLSGSTDPMTCATDVRACLKAAL